MSNGGFLSYRLACEAADSFAAIAPVAGVLGIPEMDCTPSRPVTVMHFHGTADGLVPYNGGFGSPSVAEAIEIGHGVGA
jgi:polyhydroxybutyrate depolymerase